MVLRRIEHRRELNTLRTLVRGVSCFQRFEFIRQEYSFITDGYSFSSVWAELGQRVTKAMKILMRGIVCFPVRVVAASCYYARERRYQQKHSISYFRT